MRVLGDGAVDLADSIGEPMATPVALAGPVMEIAPHGMTPYRRADGLRPYEALAGVVAQVRDQARARAASPDAQVPRNLMRADAVTRLAFTLLEHLARKVAARERELASLRAQGARLAFARALARQPSPHCFVRAGAELQRRLGAASADPAPLLLEVRDALCPRAPDRPDPRAGLRAWHGSLPEGASPKPLQELVVALGSAQPRKRGLFVVDACGGGKTAPVVELVAQNSQELAIVIGPCILAVSLSNSTRL